MYKQMSYEDIREWADNKIKEKSFEIPCTFLRLSSEDALKELVLENCTDVGLMKPSEILDKQQYLDEIEKLKTKISILENDKEKAFGYLKKIYDSVYSYIHFIKNFVNEIKSGRKSISDLDDETMWVYPPQTYTFSQCAECLGEHL
jgi:hypothetical protein